MTAYLLERAWVDGAVHDDVLVEIEDGRFTSVGLRRDTVTSGVQLGSKRQIPAQRGSRQPPRA